MAKKPMNRTSLFTIVRTQYEDHEGGGFTKPVVLGAYLSLERAEEVKGKYEQEMTDKGLFDYFEFEIQATTYYDD